VGGPGVGHVVRGAAGIAVARARGGGEECAGWRAGAARVAGCGVLAAAVAGGVWVFASSSVGGGGAVVAAVWGPARCSVRARRGAGGGCAPGGGRVSVGS
jgi:hypothetical protein